MSHFILYHTICLLCIFIVFDSYVNLCLYGTIKYFVLYCIVFKGYVWGPKFLVRTDHAALVWLKNLKNIQGMLARWLAKLQQFHFDIVHRPGAQHGNAALNVREGHAHPSRTQVIPIRNNHTLTAARAPH